VSFPAEHVDLIAQRDLSPAVAWVVRRPLNALASELEKSERLLQLSMSASRYFATGLFAITDRRVLYLSKRRFRGSTVTAINLEDIYSIEVRRGFAGVWTIYLTCGNRSRAKFIFTDEATHREKIIELLEVLPGERRQAVSGRDCTSREN
jgi:hypothetical protein